MDETTVALGVEAPTLQESVFRYLETLPGVRVVAAASDGLGLERMVRAAGPDVVVVCPTVLGSASERGGASVLVVEERETTAGLRAALRAGARGFFLWPEEREALGSGVRALRREDEGTSPGRVIAVFGPRGGAGTTFLATHLAAALTAEDRRLVLADLDLHFAGVTTALGMPSNGDVPTIADAVPAAGDLVPDDLGGFLQPHPRGFSVLLAPSHADPALAEMDGRLRPLVGALRGAFDVVVLHLPRSLDRSTLSAMESADALVVVVTLDVLAFRATHRALEVLRDRDLETRCRLVVNRARRAEIVPEDAERVFGLPPAAVIPADAAVPRAQDRGELLIGRRSRAARRVSDLARALLEEGSA